MEILGTIQSQIAGYFLCLAVITYPRTRTAVLSFVINAVLLIIHRGRKVDGSGTIPGPPYKFSNGQAAEKLLCTQEKSRKWEGNYGKVYRIWSGTKPEVVITDPKDVEILYQQSANHQKPYMGNVGWLFTQLIGSGLGFVNGERWSNLRTTVDPAFSHHKALELLPDFDNAAQEYVSKFEEYARPTISDADGKPGLLGNLNKWVQKYGLFEVAKIFYGQMTPYEQDKLWEHGRFFSYVSSRLLAGGIHCSKLTKYVHSSTWKLAKEYQVAWREFNEDMCRSRRDRGPGILIVTLTDAAKRGDITPQEVTDTIAESLFGNLDIITPVISSCILLLVENNSVQEELAIEIEQNMDNRKGYIRRKDTLLHYCLLESLRLRPPLAFTFPENPQREKQFSGYTVPKNTTVIVDAFAINIRNPFWGPDNHTYRPRRFEDIKANKLRYNLAMFGYGPRKCLGQHIADKMVKAIVYHLFHRYELSIVQSQGTDGEFKSIEAADMELALKERKSHSRRSKNKVNVACHAKLQVTSESSL